ncbi:hypothetical protein HYT45_03550 [Candidatus Uhrbacteria bacterium]|nr:hypothetical protein [Candidatus Uhrbacteria bacterium]
MRKQTSVVFAAVFALFTKQALAQDARGPTAEECASLYPCAPEKAPRIKRTRRQTRPSKQEQVNPEILRRLEELERISREQPLLQVLPDTASRDIPRETPPEQSVVNNYVTVQPPDNGERGADSAVKFVVEIGGLASVDSNWLETSPGVYGAMRFRINRLSLGVEYGYQRTAFPDGSTVENFHAEPAIGYEFGKGRLRPTLAAGLGFWTTLEDWVTPICGRNVCEGENENSLTIVLEPGLLLKAVKNLEFSVGLPIRWIAQTPDGSGWAFGIRAGLGVTVP